MKIMITKTQTAEVDFESIEKLVAEMKSGNFTDDMIEWEDSSTSISEVVVTGTFISEWSDNSFISTVGEMRDGKITADVSFDDGDHGTLVKERFLDNNGVEHHVCINCHERVLNELGECPGCGE